MKLAQIYSWVAGNENAFYQPTTIQDRKIGLLSVRKSAGQSGCRVQVVNRLAEVTAFVWVRSY